MRQTENQVAKRMRISVIGPAYPFRGGIAHHTMLMVHHLRQHHELQFISFESQYPQWLFPGKTDQDPSQSPLREPCEYLLSPLNPLSWIRTAARVRTYKPDLLVTPWWVPFWAPAWFTMTRLARLGRSIKVLYVCHNVLPHDRAWWDRLLARLTLSSGHVFITHSQPDAEDLLSLLPGACVQVTPLPTFEPVGQTDLDSTSARRSLGLGVDQPVILFFGFVRPYKGLDVLIEAIPTVRENIPVHLLVVGEMWEDETDYREQIQRLSLSPAVTVVNRYVPDEELGRYFGAADVVVLPYQSATQSAVVQLSFGFGKPVITTRVGGLAEAVHDEVNGLLVAPGNPQALADTILRFFEMNLGPVLTSGILDQREQFSWARYINTIEDLAAR